MIEWIKNIGGDLIPLIAVIINKPEALMAVAVIGIVVIFVSMYIMQAIKIVKAIPTPNTPQVNIVLTIAAIIINALLTEIAVFIAIGLHGGAWIGASAIVIAYTIYGNADPEQKLLNLLVQHTIGRVTAITNDRNIPSNATGITQNDINPNTK